MQHLMLCPKCRFWRDGLRVLSCCSMKLCAECTLAMSSCPNCNVALDVSTEEYKPYKVLVDSIMRKCRHPGCEHQATDVLIAAHEANCLLQPMSEVVVALGDAAETPKAREQRIRDNLERLKPPRVVTQTTGKQYVEHLVLRTDTLVGLSMKYGVSAKDIQRENHLATGNVHERARLLIPFTAGTLPAENAEEVIAALRRLALSKFKGATGMKENDEANYYLDCAEFDVTKAIAAYRDDVAWDRKKKPTAFDSCVKRVSSTSTPSPSSPSIPAAAEASARGPGPAAAPAPNRPPSFVQPGPVTYVGCPPPTYDESPLMSETTDVMYPQRPRPNLLQEVLCCCFFSPRTRRR